MQDKGIDARATAILSKMNISNPLSKVGLDNASYFDTNNSKLGEVKAQLDSQSDKDKMEGMKRLIAMISKGKDVSSLFPDVIKNVVTKNLEVKKLVYMYLTHYAELEPDTTLLAINTIQKALSDQNQLIRASALRVMSSIRVLDIVQLIVLAIEKSVKDSSAYVRKAAAHAISKVYRLDPDKKDQLVVIISQLLGDRSTMVLGSAVAAFVEVCPEQIELIHPHYRKLCQLLADIDEWGQILTLNLLTRYARLQFTCPDPDILENEGKTKEPKKERAFYGDEEEEEEDVKETENGVHDMDPDHRLLIKSAQPLLQSRNNGVVLAVASLYYYIAPTMEASKVGRALVRILRSNREVQYVTLTNIATMSAVRPSMFEPHLSEFFVDAGDAEFTRKSKLDIITQIATESNIARILREFKDYVKSEDKEFVTATIQAIGRCAARIEEVMPSCMSQLLTLIANPNETVVAESVIVIKMLLQLATKSITPDNQQAQKRHRAIIKHLAKLLDSIKAPMARASITWLVGEYCEAIPTVAPDVLRKLAKTYPDENDIVRLQILNLGAKLYYANPDQASKLFLYVLSLSKYDMNYDIRDRARLVRVLALNKEEKANSLTEQAKQVFINQKPAPTVASASADRFRFMLGSLSHMVNHSALNYQPLPDFPDVAPDPSVRNPPENALWESAGSPRTSKNEEHFWSDEESNKSDGDQYSDGEYDKYSDDDRDRDGDNNKGRDRRGDDDFYSDDQRSDDKYSDEYYSDEYSDEYDSYDDDELPPAKSKSQPPAKQSAPSKPAPAPAPAKSAPKAAASAAPSKSAAKPAPAPKSAPGNDLDDLFGFTSGPSAAASTQSITNDLAGLDLTLSPTISRAHPPLKQSTGGFDSSNATPRKTLLKSVVGGGLEVEYSFIRTTSLQDSKSNTVQVYFKNQSDRSLKNIKTGGKMSVTSGMTLVPFAEIDELVPGATHEDTINVTFNNATQPIKFEIIHERGVYNVTLPPSIGDLIKPHDISTQEFTDLQRKLQGLHESTDSLNIPSKNLQGIARIVKETAFLAAIPTDQDGKYRFAGKEILGQETVLVSIEVPKEGKAKCSVNCENTILGSMLLRRIVEDLSKE